MIPLESTETVKYSCVISQYNKIWTHTTLSRFSLQTDSNFHLSPGHTSPQLPLHSRFHLTPAPTSRKLSPHHAPLPPVPPLRYAPVPPELFASELRAHRMAPQQPASFLHSLDPGAYPYMEANVSTGPSCNPWTRGPTPTSRQMWVQVCCGVVYLQVVTI